MDTKQTEREAYHAGYTAGYELGKRDAVKWISVKERLPEEYTKALVATEDGQMLVAAYTSDGWMYPCYGEKPTHWMTLPEPPEVADE